MAAPSPQTEESSHPLALYAALLVAWVATLGSLYFSEIRDYIPCTLCWYQRILMYPMALLLSSGILLRVERLPLLILPFSLLGQGIGAYHYLLQKTSLFGGVSVCASGSPCTTAWINWFGFITIPFLAMVAFTLITVMALVALYTSVPPPAWKRSRVFAVFGIVVLGLVLYLSAGVQAQTVEAPAASDLFTPLTLETVPERSPIGGIGADGELAGRLLYQENCAACHGDEGGGLAGLGNSLRSSTLVYSASLEEVGAMVRRGRPADDPENESGLPMPPSGGHPDLSDSELISIVEFIRSLPSE